MCAATRRCVNTLVSDANLRDYSEFGIVARAGRYAECLNRVYYWVQNNAAAGASTRIIFGMSGYQNYGNLAGASTLSTDESDWRLMLLFRTSMRSRVPTSIAPAAAPPAAKVCGAQGSN